MSNPGYASESAPEVSEGMSIIDHLTELRSRILRSLAGLAVGMVISFIFLEGRAFQFLLAPMGGRNLMYLDLGEAFFLRIKIGLATGALLASPWIFHQIWAFISPGLYDLERRWTLGLTTSSVLLFVAGAAFCYFAVLPVVIRFFLSFETENLVYGGHLESYVSTVLWLMIAFGAAFQTPLIVVVLTKLGLVTPDTIASWRAYWIIGIFVVAAVITPTGDMATQCLLAFPMWILLEAAILASRIFIRSGTG